MARPWKGPWSVKGLKLQLHQPHGESASGLEEGSRGVWVQPAFTKALPPAQQTDEAPRLQGSGGHSFFLSHILLLPNPPCSWSKSDCFSLSYHGFRRSRTHLNAGPARRVCVHMQTAPLYFFVILEHIPGKILLCLGGQSQPPPVPENLSKQE